MQTASSLHRRPSSPFLPSFPKAHRRKLVCFPSSSNAGFSGFRFHRFWRGSHVSVRELLNMETRETFLKCMQPFNRLQASKMKAVHETDTCFQFWSGYTSSIDKRISQRIQGGFIFRELLLKKFSQNLYRRSDIFMQPKWLFKVETLARLTVLSIFLSLLMCCPSLGLNGGPAFAHGTFQQDISDKIFVVKSGNPNRQSAAAVVNSVQDGLLSTKVASLFSLSDNSAICDEAYGLFPCSKSLPGNLFLMLVYGYLLLMAARFISEGSELLLEVMNPGVIGGLLLPVLGALPDAALICASGVGGTIQEAQQEVLVGVGVLAGSTTLILTVTWAASLVAGRCDLSGPGHTAKELTLTCGFDLYKTGITTDQQTRWGALIMIASGVPYVIVQLPLLDKHPEQGPESVLAGCIFAFAGMVLYCSYQIASPWLQKMKIEEARLQFLRTSALQAITEFSAKQAIPLEQASGPSDSLLREVFTVFDKNEDGKIEQNELRGLILGLNIEQGSFQDKEQVEKWFKEFDVNTDGTLSEAEFLLGVRNWANRVAKQGKILKHKSISHGMSNFWGAKFEEAKQALRLLESELEQAEDVSSEEQGANFAINTLKIYKSSAVYLVSGAALAGIFSDPLISSIEGFSKASQIPPFFVAFVVVPLASNASELFSSIVFARKRRKRNISLTYSQIYGSVTMNNTLCLWIFLGIVYVRGLTWDFSSEVTVVLLNILIVGLIGASRVTFPTWFAIPVVSLYFLSLGGVALLDNFLGWH